MARPGLGNKRQCQNCGAKFYDLDHDPATCPKCGTVQQAVAAAVAVGRGRAVVEPARHVVVEKVADEDVTAEAEGLEPVEEDVEDVADDDAAAETADGDEDVFLEEDEEDEDGVARLIDGDIEDEET